MAERAGKMAERTNLRPIGVIENMSLLRVPPLRRARRHLRHGRRPGGGRHARRAADGAGPAGAGAARGRRRRGRRSCVTDPTHPASVALRESAHAVARATKSKVGKPLDLDDQRARRRGRRPRRTRPRRPRGPSALARIGWAHGRRRRGSRRLEHAEQQQQRGQDERGAHRQPDRDRPQRGLRRRRLGRGQVGHDQVGPLRDAPPHHHRRHGDGRARSRDALPAPGRRRQRDDARRRRRAPRTAIRPGASRATTWARPLGRPGGRSPRGRLRPRPHRARGDGTVSSSWASPRWTASTVRYVAARNAHIARTGAGHPRQRAGARPDGLACTVPPMMRIRPDAMAAAHMPNTNGVTSDAMPNTRVHARCHPVSGSPYERNANAAPRITMPADGDAERHVQRDAQRRERGGERGEQRRDHEDQPDVVRLPHRADRLEISERSLLAPRPAGRADPTRLRRSPRRRAARTASSRRRSRVSIATCSTVRSRVLLVTRPPRAASARAGSAATRTPCPSNTYVPTVATSHHTMPPRVVTASAVRIWP